MNYRPEPGDLVNVNSAVVWWKGIPTCMDPLKDDLYELWRTAAFMIQDGDFGPVVFLRCSGSMLLGLHPKHGFTITCSHVGPLLFTPAVLLCNNNISSQ